MAFLSIGYTSFDFGSFTTIFLNLAPSKRDIENQTIRSCLLELYIKYNKRLGAIKLNRRLFVEYGISISLGRVYRLLKSMPLPRMSTVKPSFKASKNNNDEECINALAHDFSVPKRFNMTKHDWTRVHPDFCGP